MAEPGLGFLEDGLLHSLNLQSHTDTISKPSNDNDDGNNELDFLDFVPIENNSDDFDLDNIISDLETIEKQNEPLQKMTNRTIL